MGLREHFGRKSPSQHRITLDLDLVTRQPVQNWKADGFLPIRLTDPSKCVVCTWTLAEYPWWYNMDMIGRTITLPLSETSITNLYAMGNIDPARVVVEILEDKADGRWGIFRKLQGKVPTGRLTQVNLCGRCAESQPFLAWVEELRQLQDIVDALELEIAQSEQEYELRWASILENRRSVANFSDIPWPVLNPREVTTPKHLKKSCVRRFLFSRCIIFTNRREGVEPRQLLRLYKRRWNPGTFESAVLWYDPRGPSYLDKERAIVAEGVAIIRRYLDEFEEEDFEVLLPDNPSEAQWNGCPQFYLCPSSKREIKEYDPTKWPRRDDGECSRSRLVEVGVCLAVGTALWAGAMQCVSVS